MEDVISWHSCGVDQELAQPHLWPELPGREQPFDDECLLILIVGTPWDRPGHRMLAHVSATLATWISSFFSLAFRSA